MTSDSPLSAVHSSDGNHGRATVPNGAQVPAPGHVPWRSVGAGVLSVGAPFGICTLHPLLGEGLAAAELVIVLTVLGTALFGSQTLSERAFRLLRWLGNRPEPPGPSSQKINGGTRRKRHQV